MLTHEEILEHINKGRYVAANVAIRERIRATGVLPKVVDAAMYYAYERGHSAGEGEVARMAFNLMSEVFEAGGR